MQKCGSASPALRKQLPRCGDEFAPVCLRPQHIPITGRAVVGAVVRRVDDKQIDRDGDESDEREGASVGCDPAAAAGDLLLSQLRQ